jgi:signal transduction histidine kinase
MRASRVKKAGVVISRADDCWPKGDPTLLRSCIENVVRNAVHYTKPQTEVAVSLDLVGNGSDSARILVTDHGDGVPPGALSRLLVTSRAAEPVWACRSRKE